MKIYDILKKCWNHKKSNCFERNFSIFKQRYLNINPPTLQEIATNLGLTRERVRQIESDTLYYIKRDLVLD